MAAELMRGRIIDIYPEGISTVYNYLCHGEEGVFSFPVEWRYHFDILENEGDPKDRLIEYDASLDPPALRFLD